MNIQFYNYEKDETEVIVEQDGMSKSSLNLTVQNDDGGESISIYMSEDEIQDFINKVQRALNNYSRNYGSRSSVDFSKQA